MKKLAILAGILMVILTGTIPANASVNWTQRTCSAFNTWEQHRTYAHLTAIVRDSFHVKWKYLGEDAVSLYSGVRTGRSLSTDLKYFREDCKGA